MLLTRHNLFTKKKLFLYKILSYLPISSRRMLEYISNLVECDGVDITVKSVGSNLTISYEADEYSLDTLFAEKITVYGNGMFKLKDSHSDGTLEYKYSSGMNVYTLNTGAFESNFHDTYHAEGGIDREGTSVVNKIAQHYAETLDFMCSSNYSRVIEIVANIIYYTNTKHINLPFIKVIIGAIKYASK